MGVSGQGEREMSADPRALRTRATVKQALMQLLKSANWGEITVAAVCRRAGVARSSFYEHFATKADVLDEIFADRMGDIRLSSRRGDPLGTLDWLVEHVAEAPEFFAHAMAGGRGDALLPRFRAALARELEKELTARGIPGPAPMAAFLVGGAMAYLAVSQTGDASAVIQNMAGRLLS